jgi:hypothetical protein
MGDRAVIVLQDEFDRILRRMYPESSEAQIQASVIALVNTVAGTVKVAHRVMLVNPHEASEPAVLAYHLDAMAADLGRFIAGEEGFCQTEIIEDRTHVRPIRGDIDPTPGKEILMRMRVMKADCTYRLIDPLKEFRK